MKNRQPGFDGSVVVEKKATGTSSSTNLAIYLETNTKK